MVRVCGVRSEAVHTCTRAAQAVRPVRLEGVRAVAVWHRNAPDRSILRACMLASTGYACRKRGIVDSGSLLMLDIRRSTALRLGRLNPKGICADCKLDRADPS